MDLRQLEMFVAVARHRHFTRAAEELYVSQSAVSQQVGRLERGLGVELLRRGTRGVELTAAGEELLRSAEAILAQVADARAAMDAHADVTRGVVRVGTGGGEALRLADALAAFHAAHPGVQIAVRQSAAGEALRRLQAGMLDVAVVTLTDAQRAATTGVDVHDLAAEPLLLALPIDDPLAGRDAVDPSDLRGRPLILGERGSALRETVMAACAATGFSPVPLFEVGDPATVRSLVHAGIGLSVVPASWLEQPGSVVVSVRFASELTLTASLLSPASGSAPAGRLLAEALVAALATPAT